jgi:hypothetical protein
MIRIEKIPLKELHKFVNSTLFLSFIDKPISNLRVASYINNPNASLEDYGLYLAFIKEELVGYRTLFSDYFVVKNKKQKFCWLSGSWTSNNHRRKGISTKLFNEIYKDWNGRIIFSNYAPKSKALYDKTNVFDCLKTLKGTRYYRRFCFAEVLQHKNRFFKILTPFFTIIDWFLNLFFDLRFKSKKENINYRIEKLNNWDKNSIAFLDTFKDEELFKRNPKTYQWINTYPWIKSDFKTKETSKNYNFSSYAKIFESHFYKITHKKTDKFIAIVNISIRDNSLKIPYLYSSPKGIKIIKNLILKLCRTHKISFLTIFHKDLNELLKENKNQFLKQKPFKQKYFVSKKLLNEFNGMIKASIQTGDGDGVFT